MNRGRGTGDQSQHDLCKLFQMWKFLPMQGEDVAKGLVSLIRMKMKITEAKGIKGLSHPGAPLEDIFRYYDNLG